MKQLSISLQNIKTERQNLFESSYSSLKNMSGFKFFELDDDVIYDPPGLRSRFFAKKSKKYQLILAKF